MLGSNLLTGFLFLIPEVLIFIASMIYWGKVKSTGSNLMFFGSMGIVVMTLIQNILIPTMMASGIIGFEFYVGFGSLALTILNFICTSIFAVGLLLLVTGGKKSA